MLAFVSFLNGRFVPANELTLSAADAGFVSGVTVTDFCRTYRHRLFRWPEHLARLRRDCATCRITIAFDDAELTAAAERLVFEHSASLPETADLAVVTFATPGPLGAYLGTTSNGPPTLGMHAFPLATERYRRFFVEGVTLAVAGVNPFAAGGIVPTDLKHRNRLAWWLAEQAVPPGSVAVLTDPDGRAADAALGSIVAVRGNDLMRSPKGTVLESVSLGVLSELAERLGLGWFETDQSTAELATADELLLVGSGFGVAGVRALTAEGIERVYDWPGLQTSRLIAAWSDLVGIAIDRQFDGALS